MLAKEAFDLGRRVFAARGGGKDVLLLALPCDCHQLLARHRAKQETASGNECIHPREYRKRMSQGLFGYCLVLLLFVLHENDVEMPLIDRSDRRNNGRTDCRAAPRATAFPTASKSWKEETSLQNLRLHSDERESQEEGSFIA
jgi:hypothetical protein